MPEEALVEVSSTPVPTPTASERKGVAQIIVSKWYWIVLFLVAIMLIAALLERMTSIFTIAVPGFGALWQKAQGTPPAATP